MVTSDAVKDWPTVAGNALPFPEAEWPKRVDLFAERSTPSPLSKEHIEDFLRAWAKQRLQDRLVSVEFKDSQSQYGELRLNVTITAHPGALDLQQRLQEAVVLGGAAIMANPIQLVTVSYPGASAGSTIEMGWLGGVMEWAQSGGDPKQLRNWLAIDGKYTKYPRNDETSLPLVLPNRNKLTPLLGPTEHLLTGIREVMIEATISPARPWESVWDEYAAKMDKIFAQNPDVSSVDFLIRNGSEMEILEFWRRDWQVYRAVASLMTDKPPAINFPLVSQWYDHLSVMTR